MGVKYNLKVHLACIRHGGKSNLKKFAKVLDLDVCEKSLRKRKDDSVHELGSRRSKKRRKLNKNNSNNGNNTHSITTQPSAYNSHGHQHGFYPKQEEYDQFAAQLLFSLSGMPPIYNQDIQNQAMDWNMAQILNMNQAQNQIPGGTIDINGNVIKSEQLQTENDQQYIMKPEQYNYYDPMYGYYSMGIPNQINDNKQNALSLSTSTMPAMWEQNGQNPKEEPIWEYNAEQMHQMNQVAASMGMPGLSHDLLQGMPQCMNNMMPSTMYYPNGYYMNFENQHLVYSANHHQNENKQIEVPPLPLPITEIEESSFEINK